MRQKVYIETSVVSYLTARPSKNVFVAGYQQATQDWWNRRRQHFDLFTSFLVIDEAGAGDQQAAQERLQALDSIPLLDPKPEAIALSKQLVEPGPLPMKAKDDAVHIALAAVHGMDYLMTWNFKHIANAEMRRAIMAICRANGFEPPITCTPEQLMGV